MKVTLQISSLKNDVFYETEAEHLTACLKVADLKDRERFLCSKLTPIRISSSDEVDLVLVLNGHEDAESWQELSEELGRL